MSTVLEKYRLTTQRLKSTEFQIGWRISDQRITTGGLKPYRCSLVGPVMAL